MDELRPEIRAAFEREQAGLAPSAALRRNLVEAVAAQPRARRSFQWVAVAAAVLLAILVVAGLMSTRLLARHANVNSPHASGARETTPVGGDYGPPPAGVNLLYVHDPNHTGWLIGYDWSGQPRATVKPDQPGSIRMAPDGQSFALGLNAKGGSGELRDRLGQPIAGSGALPGPAFPIWADDLKHMCGLSFDTHALTYTLTTVGPGEAAKSSFVTPRTQTDQEVFQLASCSFHNDRAVIVHGSGPTEAWVVKISDGTVLSHNTYAAGSLSNVVGSADGALIAENSGVSVGQIAQAAPKTTIRKVSDGSVVATLDPSIAVVAFSSDNSLVLATTTPWVGGTPVHLAVIELQTGRTIWIYSGPEQFGSAVAQPGGNGFALLIRPPAGTGPEADVVIVHGDGTTAQLPRRFEPTW
jgi:hypothetical protein